VQLNPSSALNDQAILSIQIIFLLSRFPYYLKNVSNIQYYEQTIKLSNTLSASYVYTGCQTPHTSLLVCR